MKSLTVLVDNNSLIDRYYRSEPALSFWIESGTAPVLLDTGYSDAFLRNGLKLGKDFSRLSHVALSHGHFDHTWGLDSLIRFYTEQAIEKGTADRPRIVAHPRCLDHKSVEKVGVIGSMFNRETLERFFPVTLTQEPLWLQRDLVFLGEIPGAFAFEEPAKYNQRQGKEGLEPDDLSDDSAIALQTNDGLVVITGCAHQGICSTIQYAREVTGENRVRTVIGGFHLLEASEERLRQTGTYLQSLSIPEIYPCHCVDLSAKKALANYLPVREVGSGLEIPLEK